MEHSSSTAHTHLSKEMRALATPVGQGTRPEHRPSIRATGADRGQNFFQISPTNEILPPSRKRRCVSTGSAMTAQSYYPSPEPDKTASAQKQKPQQTTAQNSPILPHFGRVNEPYESVPVVISLISDDESDEGKTTLIDLVSDNESSNTEDGASPAYMPISPITPRTASSERKSEQKQIDATPTRPRTVRQTKSEPLPRSKPTPAKLDKRIQACLRQRLPVKQCKHKGVGNNYIFETITADCLETKLMKIGVTSGHEQVRLNAIARGCKHILLEEQDDPEHIPIRLYKRAEILMHKELEDFKHSFTCHCKAKAAHREYFNIDKSVALEVVQRWRYFCKREPYDKEGNLKPFWEHRLRHFKTGGESRTKIDHMERQKRWKQFVSPWKFEMIWFDLKQLFAKLWERRWPAVALTESLFVIWLTWPSTSAILVCLFLTAVIGLETSGLNQSIFLGTLNWATDGYGGSDACCNSPTSPILVANQTISVEEDDEKQAIRDVVKAEQYEDVWA